MAFDPKIPFDLPLLPPDINLATESFVEYLLKTRTELGELNGFSFSLPNPMLLLSPAIIKESVASSNIENINTTVEKVLQMQLFSESEQRKPDKEVLRYREAVYWGFEQLKKLPISTRLVLGIKNRLLPKEENGYRRTQNAISNTTADEILYTPPRASEVSRLMNNWEKFIHADDEIDTLVKCAIAHYQFEAIHPFTDGNGRTGRILMVLYLIESKLLSLPILYISGYINKNRSEYYRALRRVSSHGDWNEYIIFMLKGFYLQAKDTKEIVLNIINLLQTSKDEIKQKYKKIYSSDLVEALFAYPIITPVNLGKRLDVNYRTASRYLRELVKGNTLRESQIGKYHLFINKPLLDLLQQ